MCTPPPVGMFTASRRWLGLVHDWLTGREAAGRYYWTY